MNPASPPDDVPLALAFYNGRDHGTWLDRLIARHDRGAQRGPYSHVELVFGLQPGGISLCFSSSWRDGGARFKRIDVRPPRWTLLPIPATPVQAHQVRTWCRAEVGGRYDIPGLLAFKLPAVRHRLNWWFCSEICTAALHTIGLLGAHRPHELSPNMLFHLARHALAPEVVR